MRRGWIIGGVMLIFLGMTAFPAGAATFASPAFQTQWVAGEAIQTDFWGPPVATSDSGRKEYYKDAPAGHRLVQYFDKGRMEWTDPPGRITNGLLPVEMIRGRVQFGDAPSSASRRRISRSRATRATPARPMRRSVAGRAASSPRRRADGRVDHDRDGRHRQYLAGQPGD